jgi:hypothetical protein
MLRFPRVAELLRGWKRGHALERLTRSAVLPAAAVGLMTAAGDSPYERFLVGRALQRAWLTATRLGLAVQPHTAALFLFACAFSGGGAAFDAATLRELSALQARLRGVFGTSGGELFLFRVFSGCEPLARSLRHAVPARSLQSPGGAG